MATRAPDEGPSRAGPSVTEIVGGGINAPDSFKKSETRVRRSFARREGVQDTASLVEAYNASRNTTERRHLREWLAGYVTAFQSEPEECLKKDGILEYAELANVKVVDVEDKKLLVDVLFTLQTFVKRDDFAERRIAEATRRFLEGVDAKAFATLSPLTEMAKALLPRLSSGPTITKETIETHGETLLALHQVFVLLQRIGRKTVSVEQKTHFQTTLSTQRRAMRDSVRYYPVLFRMKLIEQGIARLVVEDERSAIVKALTGFVPCCCAFVYMWHGLRGAITADLDPSAVEEGFIRLRDIIANRAVTERHWYNVLMTLTAARLLVLQDPAKSEIFETGFETVLECQRQIRHRESLKALRFGLIEELRVVTVEGQASVAGARAASKLTTLGTDVACTEGWNCDPDVLEALLNAVYAAHLRSADRSETAAALKKLTSVSGRRLSTRVREWIGENQSLEHKLEKHVSVAVPEKDVSELFRKVGEATGVPLTLKEVQQNMQDLRYTYLDPSFIHVPSVFEPNKVHNIDDMSFEIVLCEESALRHGTAEDHASQHYRRKTKSRTPIPLKDLLKRRPVKRGDIPREIRRLLVFGNPGTGKTCISKAIAHKWAKGDLWPELKAVYLVQVRELNATTFGDTSRSKPTLAMAIASLCFRAKEKRDHACLQAQIADDLDRPTTLLILDGLDEGDQCGTHFVNLAWDHQCKMLCLSRPYGLTNIRTRVDMEMECMGLNGSQLEDFVKAEFPGAHGIDLVTTLKENPSVWDIAHIPVNLQIICALSRATGQKLFEDGVLGISSLYHKMALLVWARYIEKLHAQDISKRSIDKQTVFEALESIALDALEEGQILIDVTLIAHHANNWNVKTVLEDSGFLFLKMEGNQYQFPHLTFQEFFAGRCLSRKLMSGHPEEHKCALQYIADNKYSEKQRVVLSFMASSFVDARRKDGFLDLLSVIDKPPIEIVGLQHLFLKLRILDASLSIDKKAVIGQIVNSLEAQNLAKNIGAILAKFTDKRKLVEVLVKNLTQVPNVVQKFYSVVIDPVLEKLKSAEEECDLLGEFARFTKGSNIGEEKLVQVLVHRSKSQEASVRKDAIAHSVSALVYAPNLFGKLAGILAMGLEDDDDEDVRIESLVQIAGASMQAPQLAPSLANVLLRVKIDRIFGICAELARSWFSGRSSSKSTTGIIRKSMGSKRGVYYLEEYCDRVHAVSKLLSYSDEYIETVLSGAKDEDEDVRGLAILQAGGALAVVPDKADSLIEMVTHGINDEDEGVRAFAMLQIGRALAAAPEKADALIEILAHSVKNENENEDVRGLAVLNIASGLATMSEKADIVIEILAHGIKHEDEAVQALRGSNWREHLPLCRRRRML